MYFLKVDCYCFESHGLYMTKPVNTYNNFYMVHVLKMLLKKTKYYFLHDNSRYRNYKLQSCEPSEHYLKSFSFYLC